MTNNRVGEKYITNEGYNIEIIEYFNRENCTIKFEDGIVKYKSRYGNVIKGNVKNPYHKSVYGVGYFCVGKYNYIDHINIYQTWQRMLQRCYYEKFQEKYSTYTDCSVVDEWRNFQEFAQWFENNYVKEWHLDKDILFKGNKIYSPETCCFVPREINQVFVKRDMKRGDCPIGVHKVGDRFQAQLKIKGKTRAHLGLFDTPEEAFQAYKFAKEAHIKEVAEMWKDKISEPTYQALINYNVEITD